ncbi:hypothetical protein KQX54_020663 [Cotesia glomerata]|uniref:Uncharacterized protein n=1 Tax=Cotesia glomerata TaxID=32391 RepID=A0AAV7J923_COTGL|nr:hypothetical protein KQX54_020663 [Cotesia glomerata]
MNKFTYSKDAFCEPKLDNGENFQDESLNPQLEFSGFYLEVIREFVDKKKQRLYWGVKMVRVVRIQE